MDSMKTSIVGNRSDYFVATKNGYIKPFTPENLYKCLVIFR